MADRIKAQPRALRTELTAERLRELLDYEPETGWFFWRISRRKASAGSKAGTRWQPPHDYVAIGIDRKIYLAHRLAWLYMTGEWSQIDVDHINGDRSDNRWVNLREAVRWQNLANSKLSATNKSGFKGVCFDKSRGLWLATISVAGVHYNLGRYATAEEAALVRREFEKKRRGVYARISYFKHEEGD